MLLRIKVSHSLVYASYLNTTWQGCLFHPGSYRHY